MLHDALIYLAAAVIAVPLFKRLGLGAVLGYLIAGVLIGPSMLRLIDDTETVLKFSEFGVVLLLFLVGLELNPRKLWQLRVPIFGMGSLQVFGTIGLVGGALWALGTPWPVALIVGIATSLSSTSLGLALMGERGLLPTAGGRSALSVLLFQDILVIPILLLVAWLAPPGATHADGGGHGPFSPLAAAGLVVGMVVLARFAMRPLLRFIANTGLREIFVAFALLLVIGAALAAEGVGASAALGTFLAGVLLAESEYRHELNIVIEPFKGLLLGLFFIAVGMGVQLSLFVEQPLLVVGGTVALVAAKLLVLFAAARAFRLCGQDGVVFSVVLSQVGEFAFVVLAAARANGSLPADVAGPMNAIVAASILSTPLLFLAVSRFVMPRMNRAEAREADAIDERNEVIVAGVGRFGQVVSRLLIGRGYGVTLIDHDPEQIELMRRFGFRAYYGDAARRDVLESAGIEEASLLVLAFDDPGRVLETAQLVRERFPHVRLLARARGRTEAFELAEHGIPFERETFRAAAAVGEQALVALGEHPHDAHRAQQAFVRHDLQMLQEAAKARGDDQTLISLAERARADLAQLLKREGLADAEDDDGAGPTHRDWMR
ncbi:monovalent cation:proton antiporter-2 (CPA2) family protein [Silanimonas sp.]|uniref:monovalent cation:proton antiporter-2 (CPA2) family protein n=1 Tax=Silanimonas sp. TaxID=1929290 RepID=UPI0022BB0CC5|nr:monovalent cation:proton antiporter-2 (CPA2) family protein [Silanimonas sp.]MCZ8116011.1 monovalent cation:proton antiporter-2 (CPA2) family protein [Silanimonas sp.]